VTKDTHILLVKAGYGFNSEDWHLYLIEIFKSTLLITGVGRLIADTPVTPLVLLIHHVGMYQMFK
jgi:hypothetical protein